jgi:beta-xylosidase
MNKTTDIRIRDPYIVAKNGTYYLYSSSVKEFISSVCVYKSTDLTNWQEPIPVYTLDTSGWKDYDLWASEVHEYKGKFYLFVSIMGKNGLRGTEISVCGRERVHDSVFKWRYSALSASYEKAAGSSLCKGRE